MSDTALARVSEIESAHYDLSARLSDLEKKAARADNDNGTPYSQSLGSIVANDKLVRSITSDFRGKATVRTEHAAITSAPSSVGSTTSGSTSLVQAQRLPSIVTPPDRRFTIRDLLASAETTAGSVEYARETGFTNNADVVSEGGQKPYSDITFDLVNSPVRTIAHLFKASRQILDDSPALAGYIDRRGRYGLKLKEEMQVFFGDGTGQNLHGIVPQASSYDTSRTAADDQDLDILLHAISQSEEAELPASGIVLSVRDWRRILGIKDGDGRYLSGGPFSTTAPRIWDLPVYPTNTFTSGQFLVGAFQEGAQIFDRMEVEVLVSSENDKDFEMNLVSVRIEERLALATYRPEAFITGDLYATSGT